MTNLWNDLGFSKTSKMYTVRTVIKIFKQTAIDGKKLSEKIFLNETQSRYFYNFE